MRAQHIGVATALLACIIWSGNFILARAIAEDISPLQLNFWRWVLATIVLLPFTIKAMRHDMQEICKHKGYIFFMSLSGITLMNTLIYKAGQSTTSINMSLLVPTAPIFIMLLARILFGEPITIRRFCAILVVILGILSIISKGDIKNILTVQFSVGDFWVLGATCCFAIYSLYIRKRPATISLAAFSGFTFLIGTIIMIPFVIVEYFIYGIPSFSSAVIISIMYAGIGCSVFAYILWTKAVEIIGPVMAGFIYFSLPLFTMIVASLFLGEELLFAHIFGGLCTITGIVVATVGVKPKVSP